jgi:hypothetical protein
MSYHDIINPAGDDLCKGALAVQATLCRIEAQ